MLNKYGVDCQLDRLLKSESIPKALRAAIKIVIYVRLLARDICIKDAKLRNF